MKCFLKQKTMVTTLFAMLSAAMQLNAQSDNHTDSTPPVLLNEAIVSATRYEQKISEIGRSVTIITKQQIEQSLCANVGELLNQYEGIFTVGTNQNPGSLQSLFMRGANSYHTQIMIDGVRISDPSSVDNGIDLSQMSLSNIERIEIIRGAHSTMFGSSAIGGIINIITQKNSSDKYLIKYSTKIGSYGNNTFALYNNLFANFNTPLGVYVTLNYRNDFVKGLNATLDTIKDETIFHTNDKDDFNKSEYIFKIGYRKNKYDVYAGINLTRQLTDLDLSAYHDDDNRTMQFNRNFVNYGFSYTLLKELKFNFAGGYTNLLRTEINDSSIIDFLGNYDGSYYKGKFGGNYINNEITATYQQKHIAVVAGLASAYETMSYNTYSCYKFWGTKYESFANIDSLSPKASINSAFFHTDIKGSFFYQWLKNLTLSLGTRYNYHSLYKDNVTYEFNPSFKLNNWLFYSSFSTAFNAPSLYRLYVPDKAFGAFTSRGNPNLKPETSYTYEFGLKKWKNDNYAITISAFYTIVNNVIDYVYLWNKNTNIDSLGFFDFKGDTYLNLSTQHIKGCEFNAGAILFKKFIIKSNLTYLITKATFNPNDIDINTTGGNYVQLFDNGQYVFDKTVTVNNLTRRPSLVFNAAISYKVSENLEITVSNRFVSKRYDVFYNSALGVYGALDKLSLPAFYLIDFSANYNLYKNLNLGLFIENILNQNYFEIDGFTTKPIGAFFKLSYKISSKVTR